MGPSAHLDAKHPTSWKLMEEERNLNESDGFGARSDIRRESSDKSHFVPPSD